MDHEENMRRSVANKRRMSHAIDSMNAAKLKAEEEERVKFARLAGD